MKQIINVNTNTNTNQDTEMKDLSKKDEPQVSIVNNSTYNGHGTDIENYWSYNIPDAPTTSLKTTTNIEGKGRGGSRKHIKHEVTTGVSAEDQPASTHDD